MSDTQNPPILQRNDNETLAYQRQALELFSDIQSDFLAMKTYTKQVVKGVGGIKTLVETLFGDKEGKGTTESKEDKKFTGSLNMNKIIPRDPGSAFIASTMLDIQEENEKKSSGLWKLLGGGLLGGGLIAGAIATLLSGLFDDGPFKGVKKLVSHLLFELGSAVMKRVIRPFKGFIDNIIKIFGDDILKPFKSFTDKIWKQIGRMGDLLVRPFKSMFDNIIRWFGGLGGKLFKGVGKGPIGKAFGKVAKFVTSKLGKLAKVLKKVPGIGTLISLGFSISRFVKGDILGGTLELVAAIGHAMPGIGTAIAWGIDILLAARDLGAFKEGGVIKGKLDVKGMFSNLWSWVKEKASALGKAIAGWPIIGDLISFAKNLGKGNYEEAIEDLSFIATPFGWLASILTGIPQGEKAKEQLNSLLKGGGGVLKAVGAKILELSSVLFGFIGDLGMFAIEQAGRGISIAKGWLDENVVSPVMGWLGSKIKSAISTVEDIASWVDENILDPITGFFKDIYKDIKRVWDAVVGDDGWIQTKLINPIYFFFGEIKSIVNEKFEKIGDWIKEYVTDPLKSFFSTIGDFFGAIGDFFSDPIGFIKDSFSGEKMEKSAEQMNETLKTSLDFMSPTETPKKRGNVEDAIIKPGGQIIHTSPEDTIIATKNDVNRQTDMGINEDRQSDKEIKVTVDSMENYDDRDIQRQNSVIIQLLERIADKEMSQTNVNTVQTTERKLNPRNLTQTMMAEVY